LEEALAMRDVKPGLIHHSDRGVQYASSTYTERLLGLGIQISMSAKGNVYDNAKAESFFKTFKQEEVYLNQYHTFEEASATIGHVIEEVYTARRLHSSLGYVPPSHVKPPIIKASAVDFGFGLVRGPSNQYPSSFSDDVSGSSSIALSPF
jgi:hypothetical protein